MSDSPKVSKGISLGQAVLSIFMIAFWATGVAAATTKGAVAILFSLFPPVAWVFSAMWFMGLL